MPKTSMGSLVVTLSASATEFEKVLMGAEKRLTGFAAKAASPINYAGKVGGLLAGSIASPAGIAASAAGAVASAFDPLSSHLFNPEKFNQAMEAVVERTVDLAREARKLDFQPQFLAGLKMAAGRDADAAIAAVKKLERVIGEASAGGDKELEHGQTNKDKLSKWGLDPNALAKMSSEDAFRTVAKRYLELGDHVAQAAMGFDVFGKRAAESGEAIKRFAADTEKYIDKIKELGLYNPNQVRLAEEEEKMKREFAARTAAVDARAFEKYGAAIGEGAQRMKEHGVLQGEFWGGAKQWYAGRMKQAAGFLGVGDSFGELNDDTQSSAIKAARNATGERSPSVAELARNLERKETADDTQKLIEKLEKEAAAAGGAGDAYEVAALKKRSYYDPANDARLDQLVSDKKSNAVNHGIDETIKHLDAEAKAWGQTAQMAKAYEMIAEGADRQKVREFLWKSDRADSQKLVDETRTPLEKFAKESDRLAELRDLGAANGGIDDKTFRRGMAKAFGNLGAGEGDYKLAPSAFRGSAEDVHQLNQQWADRQKSNKTPAQISAEALQAQKDANEKLDRVADAAEATADALKNAPVVAQFPED